MKLYLVRHGETDWNKARKIQGQVDIPLNEFGIHLAEETGKGLKDIPFDICFTSPLCRARQTAEIILKGRNIPIVDEPLIMEMAFGEYEGKCCSSQGWELPENFHRFFDGPEKYEAPEGGENFEQVKIRVGKFLERIAADDTLKDSSILVTTHGAALAGMLNYMKKEPISNYWGQGVHKNCAVSEIEKKDDGFHILTENIVYYKDKVEPWKK